jgi:hypothetical protein
MVSEKVIWIAAVVNVLGDGSYLVGAVRRRVQPNPVTWGLWSATAWIAFLGQRAEGVGLPALLTLSVALVPSLIFFASLRAGAGWRLGRLDIACGLLSVLGLVLWRVTTSGAAAIAFSIAADALAAIPTVVKAYRAPESEAAAPYVACVVSAGLTLATLSELAFSSASYAIYLLVLGIVMCVLLLGRRRVGDPVGAE